MTTSNNGIKNLMAKQQKLADAAGINVIEYIAQAEGGILKPTLVKLLKHSQAHPKECPADCTFQASLQKLRDKYSVAT